MAALTFNGSTRRRAGAASGTGWPDSSSAAAGSWGGSGSLIPHGFRGGRARIPFTSTACWPAHDEHWNPHER